MLARRRILRPRESSRGQLELVLAAASEFGGDKLERLALRLNRIDASSVSFEKLERLLERGHAGTLAAPAPSEQRQENGAQEY